MLCNSEKLMMQEVSLSTMWSERIKELNTSIGQHLAI